MSFDSLDTSLIIDLGCNYAKAGFNIESQPRCSIPTVVGRPRHQGVMVGMGRKDAYVGDEALAKSRILIGCHPISHNGQVKNWDDLEKIYHHLFYNELRVAPEEHSIMICDKYHNIQQLAASQTTRQHLCQIMFETFNVPAMCIPPSSSLSLFSHGITTGISWDSGHGMSSIVPVYEGHAHYHLTMNVEIGGYVLTEYLLKRFDFGVYFHAKDAAQPIKEEYCFTAVNEKELQNVRSSLNTNNGCNNNTTYILPDETEINIGEECVNICEFIFNPELLINNEYFLNTNQDNKKKQPWHNSWNHSQLKTNLQEKRGIHEMMYETIMKCDSEIREQMSENIVICGGNTLFKGLNQRLKYELELHSSKVKDKHSLSFNIIGGYSNEKIGCNAKYAVWLGGCIYSNFIFNEEELWMTKSEYDEYGPTAISKKCF